MATYIQHPALMGAQMADEMSRQRINEVGAAIAQRQQDIARAEERDAAAIYNALDKYAMIAANAPGNLGTAMPGLRGTFGVAGANIRQRLGIDTNFLPDQPGYRQNPSRYTAGGIPVPNIADPTLGMEELYLGSDEKRRKATPGEIFSMGRTQLTPGQAQDVQNRMGENVLQRYYNWQQNTPPPPFQPGR